MGRVTFLYYIKRLGGVFQAAYWNIWTKNPPSSINEQTYFAVQTSPQEIRQMDEYDHLSAEDEKRLSLSNELANHNTQFVATVKETVVID